MSLLHYLLAVLAGFGAGAINAVVGSGSLITFPVLVMLGLPALDANVTSNMGVLAGNISSLSGYRSQFRRAGSLLRTLVPAGIVGGLAGALLLFVLPPAAFEAVVPILVGLALVLVVAGPVINRHVGGGKGWAAPMWVVVTVTAFVSLYGGYFGAAQGVLFVGLLGVVTQLELQTINAVKIVNTLVVNLVAAIVFMTRGWVHIHWLAAGAVGAGAVVGGVLGSCLGARLPAWLLRTIIVIVGLAALVVLLSR